VEKADPQPELLPRTRWHIVRLPDWPNAVRIEMNVDTNVKSVIDDIERAMRLGGLEVKRVAA